ncbi:SDR family oxidoreductase [Chelatococcus asaccharovorans]|uniref:NAD(P)-dependent dehydrogenase (Short-subunit alcohol dehydrogenase family) n=1 Tax=Chelatococcus asaccharovorans TaxID=28210 RepID=A0A2V3U088_9HYPH|nr:SDR family oxidoreductase [Chelatococcus asaccharovorans]MBS7704406.1 SDR family oxidoreductase [Chelatococcus asaccharovorans]PXW55714.1 NAD(P)-dependent dehydrogenase (short-subunit alcohol dehydrogenase family) [Chelatococcus asaccharovorans]CAH1663918.1 FolM Alternative dihydrofolate reductase 1 [Chelatococcus asaccharovorans]CAH1682623.1 FolM Alternative dihydrofolate reductase 1 [Chelatococcus asaccharovorans]
MSDEIALVTGGARRIGRAIALRLGQAGYAVAVHYGRSRDEAEAVVAAIAAAGGRGAAVQADLAAAEAASTLVSNAVAALGPVTLLVNSASLFEPDALATITSAGWDEQMAVNLRTPVFLAQQMAAHLAEDRYGAVINILDQRVRKLTPDFFSYTLSKAGLATATRTMAQALAPRIRVNAVAPGPTLPSKRQSAEDFARQGAAALLGHGPSVEEIADAVLFLAQARSITGQILAVDGGQHLVWRTPDTEVSE